MTQIDTSLMSERMVELCAKAAHGGLTTWTAEEQNKAIGWIAKRDQLPGESLEQAYSRVVESDPRARAIYKAMRKRTPGTRPRSRPVEAEGVRKAAYERLDGLAKAHQAETGKGYYEAYTAILDTPEGRQAYQESRR